MVYYKIGYFLLLLPITLLLYQLAPKKVRWCVLLFVSLGYFVYLSKLLVIYAFVIMMITWGTAYLIDRNRHKTKELLKGLEKDEKKAVKQKQKNKQKLVLVIGVLLVIGLLVYLEYYNFFVDNINRVTNLVAGTKPLRAKDILTPMGLSFYSLQAVGYMADVYWDKVSVQKNPFKLLLFLIFFPTLMEGPIAPYTEMHSQLYEGKSLDTDNLAKGYIRIFWGLFKKLVIADRLFFIVDHIYENYEVFHGSYIIMAAITYTLQLYMEFSGVIDIVIGSGTLFNITIPENFRQPFLAKDASEFWRRWHMSLGVWFKNYIFYPVSMSKPAKKWNKYGTKLGKKHLTHVVASAMALLPVWLANGFWHGARWTYICYGLYYFVVILLEIVLDPVRLGVLSKLHISDETVWYKWVRRAKTWCIIFFGELFFRAPTLKVGVEMLKSTFRGFHFADMTLSKCTIQNVDRMDMYAIIGGLIITLIVGIFREKHTDLGGFIAQKKLPVRWLVYMGLIVAVVIFGAYGPGHEEVEMIYAGF